MFRDYTRHLLWTSILLLLSTSDPAWAQPAALPIGQPPVSCSGGTQVWPPTNVGAGTTSTAFKNPGEIGITFFGQTTCYTLLGNPVRGITVFPSPHLVVTDAPSLWSIAGGVTQEWALTGTSGTAPVFAAVHDCFDVIQEAYAVTDTAYHTLVGGQLFTSPLPGPPTAAGIVSQDAPILKTCEAVVECDNDPSTPGVQIWSQLGGVNFVTNIATDPVAPTTMYSVCDTGGGGIIACAAAAVFEATQVTVIQNGTSAVYSLGGTYSSSIPVIGGIDVTLTDGSKTFVPLACPLRVPNSRALGTNGNMSFLDCPGSNGMNFASPPPIFFP